MSLPHSNVTFVTSYIDIYDKPYVINNTNKNHHWRFNKFREIAETGIQICIYVNLQCIEMLMKMTKNYPNVKIMKIITIEDSWISKMCEQYDDLKMPEKRNVVKDTKEYMILMNSKVEYIYDTAMKNPFHSTHFAWFDFNVSHVLHDLKKSQEKLRIMSQRTLAERFIAFPGCWNHLSVDEKNNVVEPILHEIHWRFCGGFFIGDKQSIIEFYDLHKVHFPFFLFKHKTLVWEVNFWAWLEAATFYKSFKWSPTWFPGDHNDTIINIPADLYSVCLSSHTTKIKYDYPSIWSLTTTPTDIVPLSTFSDLNKNAPPQSFEPASASYLFFNGKHYLNTRYLNYTLSSTGYYIFSHPNDCIISHNVFSELNNHMCPLNYNIMKNPSQFRINGNVVDSTTHSNPKSFNYYGLEDMRLYSFQGKVKFIASSIHFTSLGKSRMLVGDYDVNNLQLSNVSVVEPPEDTWCEKNWIPLIHGGCEEGGEGGEGEGGDVEEKEWFIYKWSPLQIGCIENDKLVIKKTFNIVSPIFDNVRGSSLFVEYQNHWVGVVHFSEKNAPRYYHHMLVMLDKHTFQPLKYTQCFHFEKLGIEFCIGFSVVSSSSLANNDDEDIKKGEGEKNSFCFWISQFDKDPLFVSLDAEKLPFCFEVI